jgi:hypothetical protein
MSLLSYIVTKVVFRQPIPVYQLLIKLLYLIVGVSFYLIIFTTVIISICYITILTGADIEQNIIILTSAINTIIWVLYFGLLLQHICRNKCGNGN